MRALLLLAALLPVPARAQEVAAVLSSGLPAYEEALDAFAAALGAAPLRLPAGERPPRAVRVVAAFGTGAARAPYGERGAVIAVAAPGLEWERPRRGVSLVRMVPAPRGVISRLLSRPGKRVRRLGLVYMAPGLAPYAAALREAGKASGVDVLAVRLESVDELPDALRRWNGWLDGVWLPPDPALVTPRTVLLVSKFAESAEIPFFSPTPALADGGADGALGVSSADMGRAAAAAASRALAGQALEPVLYADEPGGRPEPPVAGTESFKTGRAR